MKPFERGSLAHMLLTYIASAPGHWTAGGLLLRFHWLSGAAITIALHQLRIERCVSEYDWRLMPSHYGLTSLGVR